MVNITGKGQNGVLFKLFHFPTLFHTQTMASKDVSVAVNTDLDQWISVLSNCKQLAENDVKKLCEKVCGRGDQLGVH